MLVLLVAYQITEEEKYLDGVIKAGDWHVAAQLGPPTHGWTLAYDGDNKPAWSRVYHPPALSSGSSHQACNTLLFMYDLTGDPKYLEPVGRYIEWEKTALMEVKIDGEEVAMRSELVEHDTGRPIAVDHQTWNIHYLDTPQDRAAFLQTGAGLFRNSEQLSEEEFPWYLFMNQPYGPELEAALEHRLRDDRPQPMRLTRAQLAESVSRYANEELHTILAAQNEGGVWPILATEFGGQGSNNIGAFFYLVEYRAYRLLSLLERSRILTGEIQQDIWDFPGPFIHETQHTLRHQNWMDLRAR